MFLQINLCFRKTPYVFVNIKCIQSVGPVHPISERIYHSGYTQKSFLVIDNYKKIWNCAKIMCWCALSISPPFFPMHCLPGAFRVMCPGKSNLLHVCCSLFGPT